MVKSNKSVSKGGSSGGGIDRISNLPEPLISGILSLLPTKCAVATSVLSTRWRFLWTSITNLDFSFDDFWHLSKEERSVKRNKFTQFVNRVLLLLIPSSIQNFRLSYKLSDPSYLDSCFSFAIRRTVGQFSFFVLDLEEPIQLPLSHTHYNMAVLTLDGAESADIHFNILAAGSVCFPSLHTLDLNRIRFTIASHSSVSFPNLMNLDLNSVDYANEDSFHKLLTSCPALDDLVIQREYWDNVHCLIIRLPSLKNLSLRFDFQSTNNNACQVQLDTPALQYLDLYDDLPCEYHVENLSSLLQANVDMIFHDDDFKVESCISICKFIGSLSSVKFLSVSGKILKAIRIASANISPGFQNLSRLELSDYECVDLSAVINNFLEGMDNLRHLVFKGWRCDCAEQSQWTEPLNVPMCMLLRVTTICFTSMTGNCCDQLELLRYFLKNAKVLRLLKISAGEEKQVELLKKISMFPRGSQTCQVAFT